MLVISAIRGITRADDGRALTGPMAGSAVLSATLSWVAYGPTDTFVAILAGSLALIAVLIFGVLVLAAGGDARERRTFRIAWLISAALVLAIPGAVAIATGVGESFVCVG